jgi:type I restriction enzyme S subunit
MRRAKVKDITVNLDNRRVPLNSSQRAEKEENPKYPYVGANKIMGYINEYIFDEKILCVAEDGGSWGYQEECARIYDEKVWVNNHAHVLKAGEGVILEYLMYYFNYSDLSLHINGATRGKLTKTSLNSIEIPLPPLDQQKKIAAILDAADAYRQKTKAVIEKYGELTQSLFLEMFGDPVTNPKGWETKLMHEVCTKVTDGTHDTPKRLKEGVKFITGKHVRPYTIDYLNSDYVTHEVHTEIYKRCNPELGDVLYTNIGANLGTAALNKVQYPFSMKNVALLKPAKELISGRYIEYFLNGERMKEKILWLASLGGAQQFLSLNQLRRMKVNIPPMAIQIQFNNHVEVIETQKAQAQASLAKAEDLFNSLLQRAFKGELV